MMIVERGQVGTVWMRLNPETQDDGIVYDAHEFVAFDGVAEFPKMWGFE